MHRLKFFTTQIKCQYILENILNAEFSTSRHDLGNYTEGHNLELDGFCNSLRIAFEYQGEQHDKYNPIFHHSYKDFLKVKQKDDYKIKLCNQKKIKLITIFTEDAKSDTDLIKNIIKKLEGVGIDKNLINYNVSLDGYYAHEYPSLYKFEDIVKSNGGKIIELISDKDNHHCATIECGLGHRFPTRVSSVERTYTWCNECKKINCYALTPSLQEHMKYKAKERGGKCEIIEEEYYDLKSRTIKVEHKASFICKKSHSPFQLSKTQFINGEWCPTCFKILLKTIKSKDGHCNKYTPYKPSGINISCRNRKHRHFQLSEEEIISGKWCPNCE
jgi:hypothetical protein